ncbi:MAG TPA: AMP-binding protein [Polyangia bacterium]|jgi:long-chain acyl-CoA synthetase
MTVAELLAAAVEEWGARDFLVDETGDAWSFAATAERARRAASGLSARGVGAGDRVALMADNSREFVAAWLGVALSGAAVVPLSTVSAPPEVAARTALAKTKLLVDDALVAELMRNDAAASFSSVDHDAVAQILFTSGTTGVAKAAAVSHVSLVAHTRNVARTVGLGPDDVILGALPLTHSFGCRMAMLLALATGARLVVMRRFDAARALALLDARGVTFWPAVPTMLAAVCAAEHDAGPTPRALGWVLSAGAPLADALCRRAEQRLGCEVRQGYGLTEASFSTIDAPPAPRTIGCVGRPVAGVEVRIAADGEVEVRGPHRMLGYLDDAAATAALIDGDGWLRTGDVGRLDGEGRLWIVDRTKDLVIRGGNNVYPSEVEAALAAHAAVADVAVVGRSDDYFGEEIVAVVVVRAGHTVSVAELAAFARARIAATKVPREFAFVDALPLGPSGKVQKRALRAAVADGTLPTAKAPK